MSSFKIVKFAGQPIELDGPWKISTGLHPDTNRATCSYHVFSSITLGTPGTIEFYGSSDSTPDVSLANWICRDAQPIEFGRDATTDIFQAIKYRLIFVDARYAFVEPRGGRLSVGLINPSTQIPTDADRTNIPLARTMHQCINACVNAMGISVTVPSLTTIQPPQDLKWFGSHAPTELDKLLAACDLIFCPQADGSYTLEQRNSGSDPTISTAVALPATSLDGADVRGDTVIFASYPTQVINTITQSDLTLPGDLAVVYRNATGAWQQIDACGAYGANTSSGSAIAEMNNHFPDTSDPAAQSACYRFLRLNPDKFDPTNSPIQRKTYQSGGGSLSTPNGLTPQIDVQVKANIAVQDPNTKLWQNATGVNVPVDRVIDGNVLSLSHRLVKLNLSGGATTTADLEGNCVAISLSTDITLRLSVGSSAWDSVNSLFAPEYFYCGYNGSAGSPSLLTNTQCQTLLNASETMVVPIAELLGMRYGLNQSTAVCNLASLQAQCLALAPRYLKDPSNQPRILEGAGFIPWTFNGIISEVEIDPTAFTTRFHMSAVYRPISKSARRELIRMHKPKEEHPHQAKTAGARTSRGDAGNSQPIQAMQPYVPPVGVPPFLLFAVNLTQNSGTNGTQTTPATFTYDVYSKGSGAAKIGSALSPEMPRYSAGYVTPATVGSSYQDSSGAIHLFQAGEVLSTVACSS